MCSSRAGVSLPQAIGGCGGARLVLERARPANRIGAHQRRQPEPRIAAARTPSRDLRGAILRIGLISNSEKRRDRRSLMANRILWRRIAAGTIRRAVEAIAVGRAAVGEAHKILRHPSSLPCEWQQNLTAGTLPVRIPNILSVCERRRVSRERQDGPCTAESRFPSSHGEVSCANESNTRRKRCRGKEPYGWSA
jgi:hypothetical protein